MNRPINDLRPLALLCLSLAWLFCSPALGQAQSLFDGRSLGQWQNTEFPGHGDVRIEEGNLILGYGEELSGVHWKGPVLRKDYELTLEAKRVDGHDFFCGLTFPVGAESCSLIVGGWGGGLIGLSSINSFDASENETSTYRDLKDNQWYKIRVRVSPERIEAWIDDDRVVNVEREDRTFSVRLELEYSVPLGIASWRTTAAIRNIEVRSLHEKPSAKTTSTRKLRPRTARRRLQNRCCRCGS